MQIIKCDYNEVPNLNKFDLAYINKEPVLNKYILHAPDLKGIEASITVRSNNFLHREILFKTLQRQNESVNNPLVKTAIDNIRNENTFCIITAHQPCLFGGPLYFVYKIASAINLSIQLNSLYPDKHFVPVYYMGSEDHDFEEINNLKLFGKTINWERESKGPIGKLDLDGLDKVVDQILANFENSKEKKDKLAELISLANAKSDYGSIIKDFVYKLFEDYPLIVLDPNDKDLKRLMIPVFKEELLNQKSASLISETLKAIEADHFKVQAPGREINLFYMLDDLRERIILEDNKFKVLNTNIQFTKDEILGELNDFPERFSPNVILRPLYQESILPGVCFIGGGGEVAYWLELKSIFEYFKVPYPVIMRRNSVLWIETGIENRINKTGLSISDFINPLKEVQTKYIRNNDSLVEFPDQKASLTAIFNAINEKVKAIDASLTGKLKGDETHVSDKINEWEARLNKALKLKHETGLNQIASIHDKLYPNNGLQERTDSFLPYYAELGKEYIKILVDNLNPLEDQFLIIKAS